MKREAKTAVSTAGLYYHPEKWMRYISGAPVIPAGVMHEVANPAAYHALYYDPAALIKYRDMTLLKKRNKSQTPDNMNFPGTRYHVPGNRKNYIPVHIQTFR
jgi:hypothetical protein